VYVLDKIYRVVQAAGIAARKRDPTCSRAQLTLLENPRQARSANAPRLCITLGDGSFRHNSVGHLTMPTGARMFRELRRLGEEIRWVDEFRTSKCCSACAADLQPAFLLRSYATPRTNAVRVAKAAAGLALKQARHDQAADASFPFANAPAREKFHTPLPKRTDETRLARCDAAGVDSDLVSSQDVDTLRAPWGLKVCTSATCKNRLVCRDAEANRNMMLRVRWHLLLQPDRLRTGLVPAVAAAPSVAASSLSASASPSFCLSSNPERASTLVSTRNY
jgi:hypothetical protein